VKRFALISLFALLSLLLVASPVLAAENKVSPTGNNDPAAAWANEALAYDGDVGTGADLTTAAGTNSWSEWIELTHDKISCFAVRVYALSDDDWIRIDVDVEVAAAWQDVYEGSYDSLAWNRYDIPSGTVEATKIRVRFFNDDDSSTETETALLREVDFITDVPNPDAITFGTGTAPLYKVFYNVHETGDMLVVAEGYVYYATALRDDTAKEAFLFEILDTAGTTTLLSRPLNEFGDRPISIYQTASQVATLGLASGTAYGIRITGNPLVFDTEEGNTISTFLTASDYVDQELGADDGVASNNNLRNFCMTMADNIENYDSPAVGYEYIITVQGVRYLSSTGGSIFEDGIPSLPVFCPILFQTVLVPLTGDTPESTGTYAQTLSVLQKWGTTISNGVSSLGDYFGVSDALAGSLIALVLVLMFSLWIYRKTDSPVVVILMVAAMPPILAWFGLMPLALSFIFTIFIVVLMAYYFFARGAI